MMFSAKDTDHSLRLLEFLEQSGQVDPQTATLMRQFSTQAKTADAGEGALSMESQRNAQSQIKRLQRINGELREFCRSLASGLGACPDCWGTYTLCRRCTGLGKPGYFAPTPEEFDSMVRPAAAAFARMNQPNASNKST